jgi:DNA repair/transcription protein MET18/MMS19
LLALATVLQHVPPSVLLESRSRLLPLLLSGLGSPQTELRLAALTSVSALLKDDVSVLSAHLSSLVPVLCDLLSYKSSQRVRMTVLECLAQLRRLPYAELHPHRGRILAALALAADDHKRAVRQQAIKARNQWFLISSE